MPKYIIKRVLIGFVTLFVLASVTFFLMKATPGSPFSLAKYKTPEALAAAEAKYNLDKPLMEQYVIYLKGVAQGNLGESMINTGRSVSYYIKTGFPVTARLGLIAFVLALVGGIALGTGAALSRHKWVNNLCMFVATIGVSVPSFLIAMIMLIVFGVQLHILPFIGLNSPLNYIMPALSLAFYPIAMIARLTRSSMLEVMNQDYIILARSKGTPYKKVVIKHALKNAMLPVVTYAGPMFAFMLTGSFVIESVFSIPGIGSAFVSCITKRDYPIIMGLTIFLGFLVITFNLITDILSAIIDPRIKLD
ncbi:ABC transporter permease [[Clostridium] innocuum]|uniref:ABC transporter permease n=1 Tax=Clostridium innocuum TaxID=1522 RepID=UPI001C38F747|nr:ABC transporter permease [[Clostridium] innocuum]MBV4067176.1 ABC transporter permease [[Clostridium] innocuum]